MAKPSRNIWLFQAKPGELDLEEALRTEMLSSFPVQQHAQRIQPGDGVILWQTGRRAGCYGLAEVIGAPVESEPAEVEQAYWHAYLEPILRVPLRITANLYNRPLTLEALRPLPPFESFNGGRPGLNYRATPEQFAAIQDLATAQDVLEEPQPEYHLGPWLNPPQNQILYGPPGTGKTYQTVIHALAIIENRSPDELQLETRYDLRRRFDSYMANGQIGFITFHQSFTYEDFIEGIKPVTRDGQVVYEVQDGLFKMLAREARRCLVGALMKQNPPPQQVRDFNQLYGAFLSYLRGQQFRFFENPARQRFFLHRQLRFGNLSLRPEKSFSTVMVQKNALQKLYNYYPHATELEQTDQVAGTKGETTAEAYRAVFRELKIFENALRQDQSEQPVEQEDSFVEVPLVTDEMIHQCRRYVLIIDEINRGNLPAIFGELITLLEADKREGRPEALSAVLPYSKSYFSVPANLYIVATMNTADRSAEPIDAALRRRFTMREVPPRPELISALAKTPLPTGIDLERLLRAINDRLSLLLDDDHRLGHAYFLELDSFDDLRKVFDHQVIPLLREYFFDDLRKIGLVLGSAFLRPRTQASMLAQFDYPLPPELSDGVAYGLRPIDEISEADFIRIYQDV